VQALARNKNIHKVEQYDVTVSVDSVAVFLLHSNLQK
jgi:hypothetical protein